MYWIEFLPCVRDRIVGGLLMRMAVRAFMFARFFAVCQFVETRRQVCGRIAKLDFAKAGLHLNPARNAWRFYKLFHFWEIELRVRPAR